MKVEFNLKISLSYLKGVHAPTAHFCLVGGFDSRAELLGALLYLWHAACEQYAEHGVRVSDATLN